MGLWLSKLYDVFSGFSGSHARILMLGLDAAGKVLFCFLFVKKISINVYHILVSYVCI